MLVRIVEVVMAFRFSGRARERARAGLTSIALLLCACGQEPPPPAPAPEVVVATVTRRDLPLTLTYPARVAGSRVVEIRAQVDGRVLERTYTEGQPVRAGQVLFRIDPAPARAAYDRATAQVAVERANIEQARREHARLEPLAGQGVVSRRELDQAASAVSQAQAALEAAEAAQRTAKLDLDYTTVRSPVAGLASKEAVTVGNLVEGGGEGGAGDLLTTVVQANPAYVEFSVPEQEYLRLRSQASISPEGLTVRIREGSTCEAVGKVDFTDTFVSATTGTIRARAVFSNENQCLVSGQFLSIEVEGLTLPDSLAVPKTAVLFAEPGPMVWVVGEDDLAQPRPLKLQGSWQDGWLVADGLQSGERVIVEGILKVAPGAKVVPLTRQEAAARRASATAPAAAAPEPPAEQ